MSVRNQFPMLAVHCVINRQHLVASNLSQEIFLLLGRVLPSTYNEGIIAAGGVWQGFSWYDKYSSYLCFMMCIRTSWQFILLRTSSLMTPIKPTTCLEFYNKSTFQNSRSFFCCCSHRPSLNIFRQYQTLLIRRLT